MRATERNKALVRRFVEAANARDYAALEAIVSPSFTRHCPATPGVEVRSYADLRAFLQTDLAVFPDSRVTLDSLVAEDDRVAFWATYAGTQSGPMGPFPPSGRRAEVEFSGYFRIAAEKVTELHVTWDNVDLLTQLGHMG